MTDLAPARPARLERLERMRASHSYWAVLAAIFLVFFLAALLPNTDWALSLIVLMQSATLLIAIWTAGWSMTERTGPFAIATAAAIAAAINLFWEGEALTATLGGVAGLLTVTLAYVIAMGAVAQNEVNSRSVGGAICVYMLFGMLFMFLFGILALVGHGPFFAQGTDGTRPLRLYFSYTTLATLGYGDYTAASNLGHALAVLEALIGQLYLVTVVAVVVTRLGRPGRKMLIHEDEREQ
ncbi:MAG TPA: potassium channel family protein [Gaiellaceae bacterium]|nr:potassium channel family protein [Gaiellaceae bacterium]